MEMTRFEISYIYDSEQYNDNVLLENTSKSYIKDKIKELHPGMNLHKTGKITCKKID